MDPMGVPMTFWSCGTQEDMDWIIRETLRLTVTPGCFNSSHMHLKDDLLGGLRSAMRHVTWDKINTVLTVTVERTAMLQLFMDGYVRRSWRFGLRGIDFHSCPRRCLNMHVRPLSQCEHTVLQCLARTCLEGAQQRLPLPVMAPPTPLADPELGASTLIGLPADPPTAHHSMETTMPPVNEEQQEQDATTTAGAPAHPLPGASGPPTMDPGRPPAFHEQVVITTPHASVHEPIPMEIKDGN